MSNGLNNSSPLHSVLVNVVVFKQDKVLVSRRSFKEAHMPGWWTIPGGKVEITAVDVHSILEKTAIREVLEETGITVSPAMQLVSNNSFIRQTNQQHVIAIVFKAQYRSGEPQALEDTIDCQWMSLEQVKQLQFPPNVQKYILDAYNLN